MTTRRQRRQNPLLEAGWEILSRNPVDGIRFVDPNVASDTSYVYVVEAVDRAGNASFPASANAPGEEPPP